MRKVDIFVRDRIVRVKYEHNNKAKEYEWEDNYNLTQNFLLRLDKINNCDKNKSNCLFRSSMKFEDKGKSDSVTKPTTVVLYQEGSESTTYRIILISLRALDWTGAIRLKKHTKGRS